MTSKQHLSWFESLTGKISMSVVTMVIGWVTIALIIFYVSIENHINTYLKDTVKADTVKIIQTIENLTNDAVVFLNLHPDTYPISSVKWQNLTLTSGIVLQYKRSKDFESPLKAHSKTLELSPDFLVTCLALNRTSFKKICLKLDAVELKKIVDTVSTSRVAIFQDLASKNALVIKGNDASNVTSLQVDDMDTSVRNSTNVSNSETKINYPSATESITDQISLTVFHVDTNISSIIESVLIPFLVILAVVTILTVPLSSWLGHTLTEPLNQIEAFCEDLTQKKFRYCLYTPYRGTYSVLFQVINRMAESIHTHFEIETKTIDQHKKIKKSQLSNLQKKYEKQILLEINEILPLIERHKNFDSQFLLDHKLVVSSVAVQVDKLKIHLKSYFKSRELTTEPDKFKNNTCTINNEHFSNAIKNEMKSILDLKGQSISLNFSLNKSVQCDETLLLLTCQNIIMAASETFENNTNFRLDVSNTQQTTIRLTGHNAPDTSGQTTQISLKNSPHHSTPSVEMANYFSNLLGIQFKIDKDPDSPSIVARLSTQINKTKKAKSV